MARTHGDLNETNIFVDPCTRKIMAIVDWAEATMSPHGYALYALDYTPAALSLPVGSTLLIPNP